MNDPPARIERWCVAEVNDWLNEHLLGVYSATFRKQEVTGRALMAMNAQTLTKDIGMKVSMLLTLGSLLNRQGSRCATRISLGCSACYRGVLNRHYAAWTH